MSRSGYSEDCDGWAMIRWRGAVASAIRGKRGQAFLREMLDALDAMPVKRLIDDDLVHGGEVCAIGSVGVKRGIDMSKIDPHDRDQVAEAFDIPRALACEIEFENDDGCGWRHDTPEQRFGRMRAWVESHIKKTPTPAG